MMLTTLLQTQSVDAKTVGTSAQALIAMQAQRFDLYSLETRLPDLNGFELCREIREVEPYAPIPKP
jgi:DNA-binding response OmpR family regulator